MDHLEHQRIIPLGNTWGHGAGTWGGFRDKWGHGAGIWGGFRGPAWWNETFRVTLGDTGLGHRVGLGASGDTGLGHGSL